MSIEEQALLITQIQDIVLSENIQQLFCGGGGGSPDLLEQNAHNK